MRRLIGLGAGALTAVALIAGATVLSTPHEPAELIVIHPDGRMETIAECAKGCSAPTPDELHPISDEEIAAQLALLADEPLGLASMPLETLLFHGGATELYLDTHGAGPLDADQARFLRTELSRHTVNIGFRLVDADGTIRGERITAIPLKEKQHLSLNETGGLKHISINGKVKRVGLHHLWTRW